MRPLRSPGCRTTLAVLALLIALPPSGGLAQAPAYPAARRDNVVDDYHGTRVADPYRWLEQLDGGETGRWLRRQHRLTRRQLDALPGRDAIRRRLTALRGSVHTEVPWREAGRLFYLENPGSRPQPLLYARRAPGDQPVMILDPQTISPDRSAGSLPVVYRR